MTMKKIFRPTLNALVDDYAAGNLTRRGAAAPLGGKRYYFKNLARVAVNIGEIVAISGVWQEQLSDTTPVKAQNDFISAYLSNKIIFTGRRAYSTNDFVLYAVAEEPIAKNGGVGYVHFLDVTEFFLARFQCDDDIKITRLDLPRNSSQVFKYHKGGDYKVVAVSEKDKSNYGYALVYYDPLIGPFTGKYIKCANSALTCPVSGCSEQYNHIHINGFPGLVLSESDCVFAPGMVHHDSVGIPIEIRATHNLYTRNWEIEYMYDGVLCGVVLGTGESADHASAYRVKTQYGTILALCNLCSATCEYTLQANQEVLVARCNSADMYLHNGSWLSSDSIYTWVIISAACPDDEEEE